MQSRRFMLASLPLLALGATWVSTAHAQQPAAYPTQMVKIIVPFSAGSQTDILARGYADQLGKHWKQDVIVENRPGLAGTSSVAKSAPDGYTLLLVSNGHAMIQSLNRNASFDPIKDFTAVARVATIPGIMVVPPENAPKTLAELIAQAKANPGKLNYASGGVGSSSHLSGELLKSMTGIDMTHIPYKGATPAVAAVLSGEAAVMIGNLPPWSGHLKGGRGRALGVTTITRHASLPDLPALAETLPGFETVAWFGLLAPAATPKPVIERINREVNTILAQDDVRQRLANSGCDAAPGSPEAFASRIAGDVARWKKLAAEKNISAD